MNKNIVVGAAIPAQSGSALNLNVTIDTSQVDMAMEKANEVIDTIKKAKSLALDLAHIMENINFSPTISETPEDVQ